MSRARRVTIPDLAEELGLSVGTVSGALNGKKTVAASTRKKVLELAASRGYRANALARALRSGGATTYGLHVPPMARTLSFYMEFAVGFADAAARNDVDVMLAASGRSGRGEAHRVDAAAVIDWVHGAGAISELIAAGIPVVAAEGVPDGAPMPAAVLRVDYDEMVGEMLSRAIGAGARSVMLVAPDHTLDSQWTNDVVIACERTCTRMQVPLTVERFPVTGSSPEVGRLLDRVLSSSDTPDCLVFAGQRLAGFATTMTDIGRPGSAVPWVASCAGDPQSEIASPFVTALDARPREFGARCAEILHDLTQGVGLESRDELWSAQWSWAEHW